MAYGTTCGDVGDRCASRGKCWIGKESGEDDDEDEDEDESVCGGVGWGDEIGQCDNVY